MENSTCHNYLNHNTVVTYQLTATDSNVNAYWLEPDFISLEILTSQPDQASVNGKYVSWHDHEKYDTLAVIGVIFNECVNNPPDIQSRGRKWYPLVLGQ